MKKILVTKFKSIGDVLLITPLLRNLKIAYPNSSIDLLIKEGTDELIRNNPYINKIYITKRNKNSRLRKLICDFQLILSLFKNKYDILITTDKGDRSALFAKLLRAKVSIGRRNDFKIKINNPFDKFFLESNQRHIIEINQDPLTVLGKSIAYFGGVEIFYDEIRNSNLEKFISNNKKFIHIHPFSQASHKELSTRLIAKIIDFCEIDLGIKVVLTGSSAFQDQIKTLEILDFAESKPLNYCGKLTLTETAYLNKFASLLIVVDTAIMHISCANKTQVLAIFGPTAINSWGPWDISKRLNTYNRAGGIQKHGIHTVISSEMDCVPCSKSGCDNNGFSSCLENIDIEIIKREIKRKLK